MFNTATLVYPLASTEDVYTLHAYYARLGVSSIVQESAELAEDVISLKPMLPEGFKKISWPVGRRPGAAPATRFDVTKHIYFNMTHKYFHSDYSNVQSLTLSEKTDIKVCLHSIL